MKKLLIVLGVLLALVAVNPGGVFTNEKRPPTELSAAQKAAIDQEAKQRAQQSFETEMIIKAKRAVREKLKDPQSAEFRDVRFATGATTGAVAYGFVNSKNSFGAFSGFQRFISNGQTTLLEEGDGRLAEAWAQIVREAAPAGPSP